MTREELVEKILLYSISKNTLLCTLKDARHMVRHTRNVITSNLRILFGDGQNMFDETELYDMFPFLRYNKDEYIVTCKDLNDVMKQCDRLNHYIKSKTLTSKETRVFYDIKKQLIQLLYRYTDMIKDEWKEIRETDNGTFMCYVVEVDNGHEYVFHQPYDNVASLYSKRKPMNIDIRQYGHDDTRYVFTCTDEEKVDMKKEMAKFSINVMVLKKYLIKKYNQANKTNVITETQN